jgi:hypothetical protein
MSEADGMDDVVEGGMRQSLMAASRLAETLARSRQESLRQREQQDTQAAHELQARQAADRATMRAALAPVDQDKWWDQAQPQDIARAHALAEARKDHDPAALAAAERIHIEVSNRYGINTRDVGADAAYLESGSRPSAPSRPGVRRSPSTGRAWLSSRQRRQKSSAPRPGR